MISPPIADGLNEKQQQSVVLSEDVNALILAGAGSGKTRVLTHRIHYLVSEKNLPLNCGFCSTESFINSSLFTEEGTGGLSETLGISSTYL